ncbi:uncharacterized protein LOC128042531 [Gossypium raimondii]|uniref:uncharacterized protein LOC128042531 n=1 Tax=Gossypium raimondii TaxID=29730 RepID=UPI00227C3A67|nr:uncharacterized protein LOC128042531 [Gossypium raimondii]
MEREYHLDKVNVVADTLSRKLMTVLRAMFARLSLASDGGLCADLQVKAEHQFPSGLLQLIAIPEWKWERITMDFVSGLPLTPSRKDWKLAELYIVEIVHLHGVPVSIIFDRDPSWERYFPLAEFAYNSNFKMSICMAPFEALYGRKCRTLLCWTELDKRRVVGSDLICETEEKVKLICYRLKVASDRQKLKYRSDLSHIVPVEEVEIRDDLSYEEEPIDILDYEVKVLRNKIVPLVKVLWCNQKVEEAA